MQFLAEQHLVAAKLVRENGAQRSGAERELYIKKSNSFVACVRLMAKDRGGICLDDFDWTSLTPDWGKIGRTNAKACAGGYCQSAPCSGSVIAEQDQRRRTEGATR